jgi:pimeloyl-ACP methyl ester carboxylesterase
VYPTIRWRVARVAIAAALLLAACSTSVPTGRADVDFAGRVDIGNGRAMYLERRGSGSPTVVLVSGLDAAADLWHRDEQPPPKVFPEVAEVTRVYAYDRPGTPYGDGSPSRSDPVLQPTTPQDAVRDLHALLRASKAPGPYVLVGHSYGGLVTRLYASTYPEEVCGMVLVDILSDGLREAMTRRQWETRKKANARKATDVAEYPDLERLDFDVSLDQLRVAAPIRPMPLLVLSADAAYGPLIPPMIGAGELPPDTPPDFGYVIDGANRIAQANFAELVPGAKHVTDTHSGHNMMIDQPRLVTESIREVVDAVRRGNSSQSASWTLKEQVAFDRRRVTSVDWEGYPILRFGTAPEIETVLLDRPGQPYLGSGEATQGPTAGAIANAVFAAIGVRLRQIPFTPDRVRVAVAAAE